MRPRTRALLVGVGVGAALGVLLAQRSVGRHRQDLFSPRPFRRLSALSYLSSHPSVDAVRLLRDFVTWETSPVLKRRAEALIRRMEAALGKTPRQA